MLLDAVKREQKTKTGDILSDGQIPAVVFGKETESISLSVKKLDFQRAFADAGESTIVDLKVSDEATPRAVLISEIQHDPVGGFPIHIGFHQIVLKDKVTVNVPVVFTGESPAVKSNLGVLLELLSEVEVEAYPRDLPKEFVVDVSSLTEVGQGLQVKDLKVDSKVEIKTDPEELVCKIDYLAAEEVEPVAAVTEAEAVAGVKATEELSEEEKAKRAEEAKKKSDKTDK